MRRFKIGNTLNCSGAIGIVSPLKNTALVFRRVSEPAEELGRLTIEDFDRAKAEGKSTVFMPFRGGIAMQPGEVYEFGPVRD